MIVDSIDRLGYYQSLNKHFPTIAEFCSNNSLKDLPPGKHQIIGDDCFVLVFHYDTKSETDGVWEGHRKYLDLHTMIDGEEGIYFQHLLFCDPAKEYDDTGDYALFHADGEKLTLTGKSFIVFSPQDIHKTGISTGGHSKPVKKAVFKLKI